MFSNIKAWHPQVDIGFFYIEDKEYYLYSNKQVLRAVPTSGLIALPTVNDFQISSAPIVVTDESFSVDSVQNSYTEENARQTPFARTWEPDLPDWKPTPHKYQRVEDLTNKLESFITTSGTVEKYIFNIQPGQFKVEYGTPDVSGFFNPVITINQGTWPPPDTGSAVVIEFEGQTASGSYIPNYIDFNPIHSPNFVNKFLTVRDIQPSGVDVFVVDETQYLTFPGAVSILNATVYDEFGGPVPGARLYWKTDGPARNMSGQFDNNHTITGWDGSSRNTYTNFSWPPGGLLGILYSQGFIITAGIKNDLNQIYTSGTVRLEVGFGELL